MLHVVAGPWRLRSAVDRTRAARVVAVDAVAPTGPVVDVVHAHEGALDAGRRVARWHGVPLVATVDTDVRPSGPAPALVLAPDDATRARLEGLGALVRVAPRALPPAAVVARYPDPALRHAALARAGAHAIAAELEDTYAALAAGRPVPDRALPDALPTITVVMATHERPALLARALAALEAQTWPADRLDLVIVDDASRDAGTGDVLAEAAERWGDRLTVLRNEQNLGAAASRNRGVAAATGSLVAFTDDDCRPHPSWLDVLASAFREDVGLVQGRTRPDPALPIGPLSRSQWTSHDHGLYETCNIAYRRTALEDLGAPPFDLDLQAQVRRAVGRRVAAHGFGEDADLGWRVREAGWSPRFAADAVVDHHVEDDLGLLLRRSLLAGAFPVLVRAHPGLRDTLLWRRAFLGRRHLLLAGGLAALAATRRPAGVLALLPWAVDLVRPDRPGGLARLRAAPVRGLRDLVELVSLVQGSARTGTVVL